MGSIRGFLQRAMYGRNGSDQLSMFLLVCYVVLNVIGGLLDSAVVSYLAMVAAIYCIFRMFSRNVSKRRAENMKFMSLFRPALQWVRCRRNMHRDKTHRYFKCPNCGQQLRVPKGKGKISITCRNCGVSFQEKT